MRLAEERISEGVRLRWYQGIAYNDMIYRERVCYPLLIHLLVRWTRNLYYLIARHTNKDYIDGVYIAGVNDGRERGERLAYIHAEQDMRELQRWRTYAAKVGRLAAEGDHVAQVFMEQDIFANSPEPEDRK